VLSDVEISRTLNALATTLRDQRLPAFDPARIEQIAAGAIGGKHELEARAVGPAAGELRLREDGTLIAAIGLRDGEWRVERKLPAGGSTWAIPR
jgi:hypothetical protein